MLGLKACNGPGLNNNNNNNNNDKAIPVTGREGP
jgi:hypothetical protein